MTHEDKAGPPLTRPAHSSIDLRFQVSRENYWLSASFSVWTHRPAHRENAPQPRGRPSDNGQRAVTRATATEAAIRDCYRRRISAAFRVLLGRHLPPAMMAANRERYCPPRFWIVTRSDLTGPEEVMNGARSTGDETTDALLDVMLAMPGRDSACLASGVLRDADGGKELVYRRVIVEPRAQEQLEDNNIPSYLLLPPSGTPEKKEEIGRRVIAGLIEVEALAAQRLFDVTTNLELDSGLANLYHVVALYGATLWDELARHLPTSRARTLREVHRLVELIHQVLLQGIADLDTVAIKAQEAAEQVDQAANEVRDQFQRSFTERPLRPARSIERSLTRVGHFEEARQQAQEACAKTGRVRDTYAALLEGIAYAFDERRARETDVLQNVGLAFAGGLAMATVAIELWSNVHQALYAQNLGGLMRAATWSIVPTVLVFAAIYWRVRHPTGLTSRRFQNLYEAVRLFLRRCSTKELELLLERHERSLAVALGHGSPARDSASRRGPRRLLRDSERPPENRQEMFAAWDKVDSELARDCASLLDALDADVPRRTRRPWTDPDLKRLRDRIERWALISLLISERPRPFSLFPLPRLAFLYRFYMEGKDEDAFVSDSDFRSLLCTWCNGLPGDIRDVSLWAQRMAEEVGDGRRRLPFDADSQGTNRREASSRRANRFLDILDHVELRVGMTRPEFRAMMGRMQTVQLSDLDTLPRASRPTLLTTWRMRTGSRKKRTMYTPDNRPKFYSNQKKARDILDTAGNMVSLRQWDSACLQAGEAAKWHFRALIAGAGQDPHRDDDIVELCEAAYDAVGLKPSGDAAEKADKALTELSRHLSALRKGTHPNGQDAKNAYTRYDADAVIEDARRIGDYVASAWDQTGAKSSTP